jgi:hypothetical protein
MYAFFAFRAFIFESLLNVSEVYSIHEPVTQIKCLYSRYRLVSLIETLLKTNRCCIGVASEHFFFEEQFVR